MREKIFALFFFCAVIFSACSEKTVYAPPVVTGAEIICTDASGEQTWQYTQPVKLRRILHCLRQQKCGGYAPVDPERMTGERLQIRLQLSDGTTRLCRQQCGQYQSVDGRRWQTIYEGGRRLYYLLHLMPSDSVAKAPPS